MSLTSSQDRAVPMDDVDADDLEVGGPEGRGPEGGDGGGDGDAGAEAEVDDDDGGLVSGLSWSRVAILGAALLFLGFSVATFLGRDQPPAADSADVGFYQDMISHHDQALRMASLELTNGSDPVVRGFAQEVITFQSYELGVMERTLAEWGYSRADRSDRAMTWMGMDVPVEQMPGMASEDEIDALADTEGRATDTLFLDLMARHHVGGLHMSQVAAGQAHAGHVRELAARMSRNQAIEINEYAMTAERLGLPVEIQRVAVPDSDES